MSDNDRVNYSMGMKLNIGNYQSIDFHASMSSDVKEEETWNQAYLRCMTFIEEKLEKKREEILGAISNDEEKN